MKITKSYLKQIIKEELEEAQETKQEDKITVTNSDGKLIVKFNGKEIPESEQLKSFKIAYTQLAMIARRLK